ncbi:MAG: c-type cytochrome [Methylococcaceae bacterium]|nr:c-type cytochrome [Methylococcaceae bacterium]
MNIKTLGSIVAAGVWLTLGASAAQAAGDAEEGRKKFYTCGGCHAIEGYSNAFPNYPVPRIGGQHAEVVIASLKAYQAGARIHGSMEGNAKTQSEQDLLDIAAYVSRFRSINVNNHVSGNVSAGKGKAAPCAGCHGEDGNSVDPNNPRLAGQYEAYLIKVLKEYKKGVRKNPIMNSMSESLSEQDIKDISAFYGSQKKGLVTISD